MTAQITHVLCDQRLTSHITKCGEIEHPRLAPFESLPDWDDPAVLDLSLTIGAQEISVLVGVNLSDYPLLAAAVAPRSPLLCPVNTSHHSAAPATDTAFALRHAISVALLEPVVALLSKCGVSECRVLGVYRRAWADMRDDHRAHFMFSFRMRERTCGLIISADEKIRALAQLAPPMPAPTHWPLRLSGRLILGVKRLACDIVRALSAGDVVLRALFSSFDTRLLDLPSAAPEATPSRRAWAAWGTPGLARVCAPIELGRQSFSLIKGPNMSDTTHFGDTDAPLDANPPEQPIPIGELELPVSFELDIAKLSLTELASMGAGYVLELETPVSKAQLRLVVHGQTIGYGELVAVGEHLGIRIIRMAPGYESHS